jgi:hypothetical protein
MPICAGSSMPVSSARVCHLFTGLAPRCAAKNIKVLIDQSFACVDVSVHTNLLLLKNIRFFHAKSIIFGVNYR